MVYLDTIDQLYHFVGLKAQLPIITIIPNYKKIQNYFRIAIGHQQ